MPHRTYLHPYRESHARHGSAFEVTLWNSPQSQAARFQAFTEMRFLAGKRILDAGCSRGDLATYLFSRHIPLGRYIGIDALPEVLSFARTRPELAGQPCEFHAGDLLTEPELFALGHPQIIIISGTLNTMTPADALSFLAHAWRHTSEALLFNFLSDRCGPQAPAQAPPARRLPTLPLLDWALQQTPQISFRQDYFPHGHDATILMSKPRGKS